MGRLEDGLIAGFLCSSLTFAVYSYGSVFLGVLVGAVMGILTVALFITNQRNFIRRLIIITFSTATWTGFILIVAHLGLNAFWNWAAFHKRIEIIPAGEPMRGVLLFPCIHLLNQILFGVATVQQIGFNIVWPPTVIIFVMSLGSYLLAALLFGRGWCGWMCFFGGIAEASSTGRKERWTLSKFRETFASEKGSFLIEIKEGIRDVKYGVLLGMVLVSFVFLWNVFCVFCWANSFLSPLNLLASIGVILVFWVILPFMTKKRTCVLICPIGAFLGLLDKISLFTVKIDKVKCNLCYDCVPVCPTYALTPGTIEKTGKPNIDCIKCGKCIEVCPQKAIDIYFRRSSLKAASYFISATTTFTAIWYPWFVIAISQLAPLLFGR